MDLVTRTGSVGGYVQCWRDLGSCRRQCRPGPWASRPTHRLRLRGRSRLVFGREVAAVLGQMDGRATIRELAWRNGLALFAMMDWAVRLIQDGVCAITSPECAAAQLWPSLR